MPTIRGERIVEGVQSEAVRRCMWGFSLVPAGGGVWVGVVRLVPSDIPYVRPVAVIGMGLAFQGVFVWLLVTRVRRLFMHHSRWYKEIAFAMANLGLLLIAFAYVYQKVGIVDAAGPDAPHQTHDFGNCLYFSVITFTTVGYGDFRPMGAVARAMAGLQGLLGYVVLALLASTVTTVIQNRAQERLQKGQET